MISKSYLIIAALAAVLILITFIMIYYSNIIFATNWNTLVTVLSFGTMSYNLFDRIQKEISAKKQNILLEYDIILEIKPFEIKQYHMMYYLRIKKTKGESIAKSVKGFITLEGTEIQNVPLQWYLQKSSSINIDNFKDLWLFSTADYHNEASALFVSHSSDTLGDTMMSRHLKDSMSRRVIVRIESDNAKVPKEPYVDTLKNIISKSVDMKS